MVKATKAKAKKAEKASNASGSSKTSSSSNAINSVCSPPPNRNGATKDNGFILNPDEQASYRRYSSEIKQLCGLLVLKVGLGCQEKKVISQKMQENYFSTSLETCYNNLTTDAIIGGRMKKLPFKFLSIGTSRARELMSGSILRKKYSTMKSYMNNTLSPLWRK